MKRYYKYILLMFLVILHPIKVHAEGMYTCDYTAKARHSKIASNINFDVNYVEDHNGVVFSVTISNLHPDIKMLDTVNNVAYSYLNSESTPKEITINGYKDGQVVKFEMSSKIRVCNNEILLSRFVTLPPFNKYYKDPVCNGVEDFIHCQKWVKVNYGYNEFVKRVNEHKKIIEDNLNKKDEETHKKNIILTFLLNSYMYILIGIIASSSVGIYILNKNEEFRF